MTAQTKDRREALTELLSIGLQMSNVCFKVAQSRGDIGPGTIQICDELRRKWDAASAKWREVKRPGDPRP